MVLYNYVIIKMLGNECKQVKVPILTTKNSDAMRMMGVGPTFMK